MDHLVAHESAIPATLSSLGWNEGFFGPYLAHGRPGEFPGRIVAVHRGRYRVTTLRDDRFLELEASPTDRLSFTAASNAELPAVGDWVTLQPPEGGTTLVTSILPRKSAFARKAAGKGVEAQVIAANVDTALIITAAGRNWSPARIERYITLAWEAGVQPVIVITKIDLAGDPGLLLAEAEAVSTGSPVVAVSALEGRGLEGLGPFLGRGRTLVLLGSSGAGKSTLLNALAGVELSSTKELREGDERGRHTTTRRELFTLPEGRPGAGALIIDTPGLREVQLWAGEEALESSFADVEALAAACRFRDCSHQEEPGCAVRAALESGELPRQRYAGYRKQLREIAHLERRDDLNLTRAESERWRTINKSMRGYSKERRSIQGKSR
ncbi:MAG: ribosome small subunit-dependent GTPase A [Spirochaetota bacterium]